MSGALPRTFTFSKLEAVVLLELLLRVSVLELSVISSSSCRSDVSVSIWSTTCATVRMKMVRKACPSEGIEKQKHSPLSVSSYSELKHPFFFIIVSLINRILILILILIGMASLLTHHLNMKKIQLETLWNEIPFLSLQALLGSIIVSEL